MHSSFSPLFSRDVPPLNVIKKIVIDCHGSHVGITIDSWRRCARRLKTEAYALHLACRDPRVPLCAKLLAMLVVAYAFSPIDLIPDFIPILGHLDDLVLIPLGIAITIKMIPEDVLAECRERASQAMGVKKTLNWVAAFATIGIWAATVFFLVTSVLRSARSQP